MVIVTAFEPFAGREKNSSQLVLNKLDGVEKVILPVVYDECWKVLLGHIERLNPTAVICIGEAKRERTETERYARNLKSSSVADNSGRVESGSAIIEGAPEIYQTNFPLGEFAAVSEDAGRYVCNNLYFHLLHYIYNVKPQMKGLFVHVPVGCGGKDEALALQKIVNSVAK